MMSLYYCIVLLMPSTVALLKLQWIKGSPSCNIHFPFLHTLLDKLESLEWVAKSKDWWKQLHMIQTFKITKSGTRGPPINWTHYQSNHNIYERAGSMLGQVGKYSPESLITFENIFDAPTTVDLCPKVFVVAQKFLWKCRNFVWLCGNICDCA